jgi:hypothetical protein
VSFNSDVSLYRNSEPSHAGFLPPLTGVDTTSQVLSCWWQIEITILYNTVEERNVGTKFPNRSSVYLVESCGLRYRRDEPVKCSSLTL